MAGKEASVRWDFTASKPEEVSVRVGEVVVVIDDKAKWWKVENEAHQIGFVPSNYLKMKEKKPKAFTAFTSLFKGKEKSDKERPTVRLSDPSASTSHSGPPSPMPLSPGKADPSQPVRKLSNDATHYGVVTEQQTSNRRSIEQAPPSHHSHAQHHQHSVMSAPMIAVRSPSIAGGAMEEAARTAENNNSNSGNNSNSNGPTSGGSGGSGATLGRSFSGPGNPNRRSMLDDMGHSFDEDMGAEDCSILVRCAWDFVALTSDELSLRKGDIVTVLQKDGGEWWLGMVSGREGWFPWKFVEDVVDQRQSVEVIGQARAVHDFHSDYRSEVSFLRGETMEIFGRVNDDWLEVRVAEDAGRVGIVPCNYVQIVSGPGAGAPAPQSPNHRRKLTNESGTVRSVSPQRPSAPSLASIVPSLPRGNSSAGEDDDTSHNRHASIKYAQLSYGPPSSSQSAIRGEPASAEDATSYTTVTRQQLQNNPHPLQYAQQVHGGSQSDESSRMYPSLQGMGGGPAATSTAGTQRRESNSEQGQLWTFPARRPSLSHGGAFTNENPPPVMPRRQSEDAGAGTLVRKTSASSSQRPVSMADPTMLQRTPDPMCDHPRPASYNGTPLPAYENFTAMDALAAKPWFFGKISRPQSEQLLMDHGLHQEFLVRESETKPGDFTISLRVETAVKHFRIASGSGGSSFLIGTREFTNLEDLVHFYESNPICLTPAGRVMLGRPLRK